MGEGKRKRGRKPKTSDEETKDFQHATTTANDVPSASVPTPATEPNPDANNLSSSRRGRGRPRKITKNENPRPNIGASPERRGTRHAEQNGDFTHSTTAMTTTTAITTAAVVSEPVRWETVVKVVPSMDAVVKVFCVHTEPNFSLMWQRKRQYSSSSSGFIIGGKRVLTNAHSVEHHTQVKLKKRGSDTKYLATVLAIGTECDIGNVKLGFFLFSAKGNLVLS